jgi:hypothetical protein
MSNDEKKAELAKQMLLIEQQGETAKLEVSYKDGKLVAATKIQPLLK